MSRHRHEPMLRFLENKIKHFPSAECSSDISLQYKPRGREEEEAGLEGVTESQRDSGEINEGAVDMENSIEKME